MAVAFPWTGRHLDCTVYRITLAIDKRQHQDSSPPSWSRRSPVRPPPPGLRRGIAPHRWVAQDAPELAVSMQPLHDWSASLKGPAQPSAITRATCESCIDLLSTEPPGTDSRDAVAGNGGP